MTRTPLSIESYGNRIAELAAILSAELRNANHPEPSFAADGPFALPATPEIQGVRLQLIEHLMDMLHLATGPTEYVIQQVFLLNQESFVFDALHRFNFYSAIPLSSSASYGEIASHTHLPESIVRRLLRFAIASHLFAEETPGSDRVVHTSATAFIASQPVIGSLIAHCMEDVKPAAVQGVEALQKWFEGTSQPTEENEHCAFPLAFEDGKRRDLSFLEFLENYEKPNQPRGFRAIRMGEAMQALPLMATVGVDTVLDLYDWAALADKTVVDVGGGTGHISVTLANQYPRIRFIVQDLSAMEPAFHATVPNELQDTGRVTFQAHDFFTLQPVEADVYLIKSVLHDWSDKYVVDIMRQLVPAMRPGARVVLFDVILPAVSPRSVQRLLAAVDLQMHIMQNSKERTIEDWKRVLKLATPQLEVAEIHVVPGALLGIIELVYKLSSI